MRVEFGGKVKFDPINFLNIENLKFKIEKKLHFLATTPPPPSC